MLDACQDRTWRTLRKHGLGRPLEALGRGWRPKGSLVVLIFDLADDLLEDVLEGHDPQERAGRVAYHGHRAPLAPEGAEQTCHRLLDRKSTRLNSSHLGISYAVFCLKKKKQKLYAGGDQQQSVALPARRHSRRPRAASRL